MARMSEEKINEIRQSVDIVDVIGAYLPLEKKGRNYVTVCPFHDDTNPSMSISPEKQIFMCFVCHHGGNVFTFLKDYLKISYMEAVKKVAEIGRIDISEYQIVTEKKPVNPKLEPLYKMHEEASRIYGHYLNTKLGLPAKEYLTSRNMTEEIIDTFQIGFAPQDNVLVKSFEKMEFPLIDMYRSGLVIESSKGFDRFTNRIMFPLHNQEGRVVGFSGRIFGNGQSESKYMNSPESEIFIKGEMLYNYHRVKDSVRQAGHIIICEGFMDVIALYKAGIKNVVAIMGTALTSGHIHALHRLTKNIYLCLDGDQAGKNATLKCIEPLEKSGFDVKIIALPDGKDPDEIVEEKGMDELLAILKKPMPSIMFKMAYHYDKSNMENYEERKQYLETIAKAIGEIQDPIDRDYYIQELEKKSGFSKEIIVSVVTKNSVVLEPKKKEITYQQSKDIISKYSKAERNLLYYMMEDRNVALRYEAKVGFMFDAIYKIIASYIVDFYRQNFVLEVADLINSIDDQKIVQNIIAISQLHLPPIVEQGKYNYQVIDDYINIIKAKTKKLEIDELSKSLANTQDQQQKVKILEKIISLKEKE